MTGKNNSSQEEIDLLLTCGCLVLEDVEGILYTPSIGDRRYCKTHKRDVYIARVGTPMNKKEVRESRNKKPR